MAKELTVTLNTGAQMPAYGLGTYLSKPGEVGAAVEAALKSGCRHIDCAHVYMNEGEIGEALQKCFKEGVVKREEIFITSKLSALEYEPENVLPACQLSMKNLQVDYLDLYLYHCPLRVRKGSQFPFPDEDKLLYDEKSTSETWKSMEDLVDKGLVKAIGISNFTITKTEKLLKTAKIVPAVNQVECHPYFQQPKLKAYCDKKGIIIEAYSPLGNPGRVSGSKDSEPVVMEDPVIKEIAEIRKASPAQVCIAYGLHQGIVVIPKTVNPVRIVENYKSTSLSLTEDDIKRLVTIDKNLRLMKLLLFLRSETTMEEAWDIEADESFVL